MSRVYTGGTFDLFHNGHVRLLARCRDIAGPDGYVVVSLNTDEFVYRYKKEFPVYNECDRYNILSACRYVDKVIFNSGCEDSTPAITVAEPDYIVIGSDWAQRDYHKQMGFTQSWLDERGIGLVYVPYTQGISTTATKKKISNG